MTGPLDDRELMTALERCVAAHGGSIHERTADVSVLRDLEQAIEGYVRGRVHEEVNTYFCPDCGEPCGNE